MKEAKSIVNTICLMCRSEEFVTFPNKQIDREVKSLQVQPKTDVVSGKVKWTTLITILQKMAVVSMKMQYVLVGVVG